MKDRNMTLRELIEWHADQAKHAGAQADAGDNRSKNIRRFQFHKDAVHLLADIKAGTEMLTTAGLKK
jgi:hypothetical protein